MAHFAELDEDDIVIRVLVVRNEDILDEQGEESEEAGIAHLLSILPESGPWVQTSYNDNFRVRYAGIGMRYYRDHDGFGEPGPPEDFPSWVLDEQSLTYVPPQPMPVEPAPDAHLWAWDEPTTSWVAQEIPPPEPLDGHEWTWSSQFGWVPVPLEDADA